MISKIKEVQVFVFPECGRESEGKGQIEGCIKNHEQSRCQHQNVVYELDNDDRIYDGEFYYYDMSISKRCSNCGHLRERSFHIEDFNFSQDQLKGFFDKASKI